MYHPSELLQQTAARTWEGTGSGKEREVSQVTRESAPRGGAKPASETTWENLGRRDAEG